MNLRHTATVLFAIASTGCTFAAAPAHHTSTNQGLMALWLVPAEEPEAIAHDEIRLNVPWAEAQAEVKKRLEGLGLRLRKTTPNRMRFTLSLDESSHVEVEVASAANGQSTRVVVRRGVDSEAAAGVATKVRRAMKAFGAPTGAPTAPPSTTTPLSPAKPPSTTAPLPPATPPSTTAPLPPTTPPSTTAPPPAAKPLSAPSSVQDAMERPLAPVATPPPSPVSPPSAKPPGRGRRGSKSSSPR